MTLYPIDQFQAKTGSNVSQFTHSNWITVSYYLCPKHKSLHNNLEYGLAIINRALDHSNLYYPTFLVKIQIRSNTSKPPDS